MSETCTTEEKVKKKRGRKPNPNKKNYYFCFREEKAIVDYITSNNEIEKNKIFNEILRPAFTKMIESIIRRYNLYTPDEEFNDTFDDTLSFLMTKLSCFNPNANHKAYSYCGTICKNYLIYKINQFSNKQKRNVSYDTPSSTPMKESLNDDVRYSYSDSDQRKVFLMELTGNTVRNIEKILSTKNDGKLTDNEIKVGNALVNLLKNWDDLFAQMGSDKFNKSSILLFLKETTNLSTKEIRESMKVYKKRYYDVKNDLMNE